MNEMWEQGKYVEKPVDVLKYSVRIKTIVSFIVTITYENSESSSRVNSKVPVVIPVFKTWKKYSVIYYVFYEFQYTNYYSQLNDLVR